VFDSCTSEQNLIVDGTCKGEEVAVIAKEEPAEKSSSTALIIVIVLMAIIILVLIAILLYRKYKNDQSKGQIESENVKMVKNNKKANLEEMPISNLDIYDDRPDSPPLPTLMAKTNDDGLKINLESLQQRKDLYKSILDSQGALHKDVEEQNSEAGGEELIQIYL
jgi:type IV secretory pathway VirB10-like protein